MNLRAYQPLRIQKFPHRHLQLSVSQTEPLTQPNAHPACSLSSFSSISLRGTILLQWLNQKHSIDFPPSLFLCLTFKESCHFSFLDYFSSSAVSLQLYVILRPFLDHWNRVLTSLFPLLLPLEHRVTC